MTGRTPIHPRWGILEIAGLTAAFFAGLWLLGPRIASHPEAHFVFWGMIALGALHVLWLSPRVLHRDPPAWRGWGGADGDDGRRPGAFRTAWRAYAAWTALAAIFLIAYAGWRDPARLARLDWTAMGIKFGGYVVFGMVQAMIFFGFIQCRIRAMLPMPTGARAGWRHRLWVALLTSLIFAIYHLPNPALMLFALLAGFCWSWIFYQRPNILLVGLSHALLGTLLHRVVQLHMRIGPFYHQTELYILRNVVPGVKDLIGTHY